MILPLLLACASRVTVGDAPVADVPAPADYDAAVAAATRELRLYERMSTALFLRVARVDADFARAREDLRAHLLLLEDGPARVAAAVAEAEAAHVFVISADSQWRDELEFGFDEDATWRLRLFAGGTPCTPETITERDPEPIDARLHPFHNRWSSLWTARFAADCGRQLPLVLQVTGPHGTGELGWRSNSAG